MGKVHNNQNGFSAVALILVLIAVSLTSVAGFIVYKHHNKPTNSSSAPAITVSEVSNNAAQNKLASFMSGMRQLNTTVLCTDGDAGQVSDNRTPTYAVYYSLDDQPNLEQKVTSFAAEMGYSLKVDTSKINNLQRAESLVRPADVNVLNEKYDSKNVYLTSDTTHSYTHPEMNVKIIRGGFISLNCNDVSMDQYGRHDSPSNGKVLLEVDLELYPAK